MQTIESVLITSVQCGGSGPVVVGGWPSWFNYRPVDNRDNLLSPCQAYQEILETATEEVIIYLHDDLEIRDSRFVNRILSVFESHPNAVAVGLGGATSLGQPDLYRKPYQLANMARGGYASNQVDAEVHGERFEGVRRVVVLDAFCMAVRRDFLLSVGGWPTRHLTHHCLDLWLACEAARAQRHIYMVGAECTHYGGGTSIKEAYAKASWLQGGNRQSEHEEPHKWLYRRYADVLPIRSAYANGR